MRSLMVSPQTFELSWFPQANWFHPSERIRFNPSERMLIAALMSRSCRTQHVGQVQKRSSMVRSSFLNVQPGVEHNLEEGYHCDTKTRRLPCHSSLYSSCRRKAPQEASVQLLLFPRSLVFTRDVMKYLHPICMKSIAGRASAAI